MHPVFFSFGNIHIHWYGVMMALGMLAGMISWVWLGRRDQRSPAFCSDLLFWIVIAAVLGARIAYIASEWSYFAQNPLMMIRIDQGGLIYYGGMIAATGAVYLYAKTHKEPVLSLYDFVATSLPLAHAFGRIGCFLNGCCHGAASAGPAGVCYPAGSFAWTHQVQERLLTGDAPQSLAVHPVQLYEAALGLLVYVALLFIYRKRAQPGTTTAAYLILYPTIRFSLEFLRGDERAMVAGLTVAQAISIGLLVCGAVLLTAVRLAANRKER